MRAIWSLWEDNGSKINGGFRTKKELAMMLALSVEKAREQFDHTVFITNDYGAELVKKYKIPFDEVQVVLNQFNYNLNPDLWAYIKIYAYSIQTEQFLHIDNDVILWQKIPEETLKADLFFQNKEYTATHTGYGRLLAEAKGFPKVDYAILASNPLFAYNCGVVGVNNLEIIKEWKAAADQYLFHPKNQSTWTAITDKHSHNHLFEQYFISAIIKNRGLEENVKTLLGDNFRKDAVTKFLMTHLWGEAKRKDSAMIRMKSRLYKDYPKYKEVFEEKLSHAEIFDDIYKLEKWGQGQGSGGGSTPAITFEYRRFLEKFLNEKRIQSVLDFGCGDWQFSKLIDWENIRYVGVDCVKTVIDLNNKEYRTDEITFEESDSVPFNEHFDLLIMKDVLIHWTNEEIKKFFSEFQKSKFKYALITNHTKDDKKNEDISVGEFHNLDINAEPFNVGAEKVFVWENDPKITYLLKNASYC